MLDRDLIPDEYWLSDEELEMDSEELEELKRQNEIDRQMDKYDL